MIIILNVRKKVKYNVQVKERYYVYDLTEVKIGNVADRLIQGTGNREIKTDRFNQQ